VCGVGYSRRQWTVVIVPNDVLNQES